VVSRSEIVAEALSWCGTPWHHHQGVKGAGVDCVQFLLKVGQAVGAIPADIVVENYEPLARGSFLVRHLDKWLEPVVGVNYFFCPGDVLLMNIGGLETHVGIAVDNANFVHASARHRVVIVSPTFRYEHMIKRIYEVPGVIDG
jgi:cell wall-associated NlpC family hydrolase